jgi:hypothetical protein
MKRNRALVQILREKWIAYPIVMETIEVFLIALLFVSQVEARTAIDSLHSHQVSVHQQPLVVASPSPGAPAEKETVVRLPGHVLPALKEAQPAPIVPGADAELLTLTVILNRTDQSGVDRYLREVYDPHSFQYRRFLSQSEIAARFGPTKEAYKNVLAYLKKYGFTLVQGSENRLTLTMRGTRAQAERAFDAHIRNFEAGSRQFFANDTDPAVPRSLASYIQAITGLSNLSVPEPAGAIDSLVVSIARAIGGALLPEYVGFLLVDAEFAAAEAASFGVTEVELIDAAMTAQEIYAVIGDPVRATGAGQKIGLLAFSSFQLSDVADWLAVIGLPASRIGQVSQVDVNGGAPLGADESDALLGIQTVLTIAPGAQVVVYDAPFTGPGTSFQTLFNTMINDGVTVISNSFGYCEDQTTLADAQSIDAILATAAASGISVFNATGDTGSACNDGAANTIQVPADSPNATAVGGTTLTFGPRFTYGTESWWDGSTAVPPSGQGGFGLSKFFSRPAYQDGLNTAPMRSIPDVVAPADPLKNGSIICQADAEGCPTGIRIGGTSLATPIWAALTALLNEAQGHPHGLLNPLIYPLAGTNAFHSAASMGTDAAHVGLGSPNGILLALALGGHVAGPADPSISSLTVSSPNPFQPFFGTIPADGSTAAAVVVRLQDVNDNIVPGKTVTLSAGAGSHAVITPVSGVSSDANGAVIFTVKDSTIENLTFTATDVTDGVTLAQTATVQFVGPPPSTTSLDVNPSNVIADGIATSTITVKLLDAHGNGIPGKQITLSQGGGHSLISGPSPSVTDSTGQIQFSVTDQVNETVTYTAKDVSDGLVISKTVQVTFFGGGGSCVSNLTPPTGANGNIVTPFATGFLAQNFLFGGINFIGCPGASNPVFSTSGPVLVADFVTGDLYRFGLGGGAVSNGSVLSNLGKTLGELTFGKDGSLYGILATNASTNLGSIVQIDPATGQVLRTVASNLTCPTGLAVDPLSGDLFFDDNCSVFNEDPSIFRVQNPASSNPSVVIYATLPTKSNGKITFAPNGTLYVVGQILTGFILNPQAPVLRVAGTNTTSPGAVTSLPGVTSDYGVAGIAVGETQPDGEARSLIIHSNNALQLVDITANPVTTTALANGSIGAGVIGPDGCLYSGISDTVYKLTDSSGGCRFTPTNPSPSLSLTPTTVLPDPAQGTPATFTAIFHNLNVPTGTPVTLTVIGPNLQPRLARTDDSGRATFTYIGTFTGTDALVATATVGTQTLTSNVAQVTWTAGAHTTFLSLNTSPSGGTVGKPLTLTGTLVDVSAAPAAVLDNQTLSLSLAGQTCTGTTDSTGTASCTIVPNVAAESYSLTADFDGTNQFLPSSVNKTVYLVDAPISAATPPTIFPTVSGTLGNNGWYTSDVTVSWTVTDNGSAITNKSGCDSATVTTDTLGTTFTCSATNGGGTASKSVTIPHDVTSPTIIGSASPAANANGWSNSSVTVSFTCTDATSGVASCTAPQNLNEGAGQSVSGNAADKAGNTANTQITGINVDLAAPVVTVTGVTNGATYTLGSIPAAGCSTTDILSGVQTNAILSVTGGNADGTGTFTASCTGALDKAGNPGATASVTYQVSGGSTGPIKTGALTIGFWQNKNGQAIITGGAATGGVCKSGTWLRQYAPYQDLSATATCSKVATYTTTIIKAATASGASMNAMLKAQMLATALDVYFSDLALGGNKIAAPKPIGSVAIDLTLICMMIDSSSGIATCGGVYQNAGSAFGGASSLSVSQMLGYAASQSNASGSVWYGQVKATQGLAKNAFDAVNNQVAFAF